MAKKKTAEKQKPVEILDLEKAYKITIKQTDEHESGVLYSSYKTNSNNEVIHLSINDIGQIDLSKIKNFSRLEHLALSRNRLEDISMLEPQLHLTSLFLGGNSLTDISALNNFPSLKELVLWGNPIKDLRPLESMHGLKGLYCQDLNLDNINFIKNLINIEIIYADENRISNIEVLKYLKNLERISLCSNFIADISPLQELQKIKFIDFTDNVIRNIPTKIAEKFHWLDISLLHSNIIPERNIYKEVINLQNNPLEFPPSSVIELGAETTKNYYETAELYGHAPLSEGRIIFVGDGSAGKSSLIERILYGSFELGRSQTNGIKIERWYIQHEDNRNLTFNIWDFGGQEIQHAVHKFFFTEGCLYVLVLDNRKEEDPEYWLQQIESLGGSASVLVVFNKQDDNAIEIADRKFLKEKYPNIVGFYNTSCKTGVGIDDFKKDLAYQVIRLGTVEEQFPNNWFKIKKAIESYTSGAQHYLDYNTYRQICKANNVEGESTQKLLLKYFTTIGAVTWFGDTYLNFLHVLSPAWITQGVYKIVTSKKTAHLLGHINISDFNELLKPLSNEDYTYEENHYGYILSMMKKFDLCYTPNDEDLLLPSAFGKVPKLEYSEFRGEQVRTYILQFRDYMPMALIHRFIAKKLSDVYDNNYWYSGIVIKDSKTESLSMVQADKEAKRIYIRIKGGSQLGVWEYVRREFDGISSSYANINYSELIALDDKAESTVTYEDLISHIKANKPIYFHPKQQKDYNVGYLIGLFENKRNTIEKFKKDKAYASRDFERQEKILPLVVNILNNNSPTIETQINTQLNIDIDLQFVNSLSTDVKGEASYLLDALGGLSESNRALSDALSKVIQFADDTKAAQNSGDVKSKGWGRKLKNVVQTLGSSGEQIKNMEDGTNALKSMLNGLKSLVSQFNLKDVTDLFENI